MRKVTGEEKEKEKKAIDDTTFGIHDKKEDEAARKEAEEHPDYGVGSVTES